ncbi:MAG: right-handed parallel beta-helix repeat-containing protein [Verrucomicrobia bacterium]|nr:right-handed parallel beta-helix repeat-containing protein [Verrucomicrobiota bacterium]MCH8528024.1 right-handed parallel beta-helix repeat-containing protein [Kiritimatiellia bacterium]
MTRLITALIAVLTFWGPLAAREESLLFRWDFSEGRGNTVRDASGNGLDGILRAERIDTPDGKGVFLDGTAGRVIEVTLPEELRFGRGSWSFMAWVRPKQFAIDSHQNQRRLFDYGTFPRANLVLDISGTGRFLSYFCYQEGDGPLVSAGGGSPVALEAGQWTHLAAVVDRGEGTLHLYVNGYAGPGSRLPADFDGDYSVTGRLTVGSGWQNFQGTVDEVSVYRRALSSDEVRGAFRARREVFGVEESPALRAALQREALASAFEAVAAAWSAGDFPAVRAECARVLADTGFPAHARSYAHLRIAQSHSAEGNPAAARAEYLRIADDETYPGVHRAEAAERAGELERESRGLPARDPEASRTPIPLIENFTAEFFVSPDGNDDHDGSRQRPFATLEHARDTVRALLRRGVDGPVGVRLLPGEYPMTRTFELTAADSGTAGAPVVYRADEPGTAVLYGGARLDGFVPVSDPAVLARLPEASRDRVVQLNLRERGIADYGELRARGVGQPDAAPTLELYFDGRPMTLARWPNEGFTGIRELVQRGSRADGTPSVIGYLDDRHERWLEAEDPWLFGYFHFLWADATAKIGRIDPETRTLTTAEPYEYDGRGMDAGQGIIYYAFNLLEEIEQPGEWYLNRDTGILYFYPPSDPNRATVEIGMFAAPMVTLNRVENVRLEGLVFDLGRDHGLVISDSSRILVAGCTVKRMAGNGVMIRGGEANGLFGCHIHTIGRRASEVIGGDRRTLTPGRHFVENCRFHDFGRIDRTYTPAIQLEGVGNRVAHNLMYNAPSSVMRIEGNDHLVEMNDVHSAVTESDDQGAIDMWGNPTYRGIVFRHNIFRDILKTGDEPAIHGQAAIRFDDAISGMVVYGNLFVRSSGGNFGAVQMNSGRDNIMDNNLFVDCALGITGGWNPNNPFWQALRDTPEPHGYITNDLYRSRYPEIATMLDDPAANHAWRNIFHRTGVAVHPYGPGDIERFENAEFGEEDPGFVNAADGDYRLRPDAPALQRIGFRPLPLDEVGLYSHPLRANRSASPAQVE